MCENLELSTLPKTWILDIDGTILKHNGYKTDGEDTFIAGAKKFLDSIPKEDFIIFITSRSDKYADMTENFFKAHNVRFNSIIYNAPYGERILINDSKPSGLKMAYAVCPERDVFPDLNIKIDITK